MAGLTTVKDTLSGASSGAAIGTSIAPGWGTAIGGVLGGFVGLFTGLWESSNEDELRALQEQQLREQTMVSLASNYDSAQSLYVSQDAQIRQLEYNNSQLADYMDEYGRAYQSAIQSNFETGLSNYRQLMSNFSNKETTAAALGHIGGSSALVVEQAKEDVQRYVGADMLLDEKGGLFGYSMSQLYDTMNQASSDGSLQLEINNQALYGNTETGDIGLYKAHEATANMRSKYRSNFFERGTREEEDEFLASRMLQLSEVEKANRETVSESRTSYSGYTVKLYADDYWEAYDGDSLVDSGEGEKGYWRFDPEPDPDTGGDGDDPMDGDPYFTRNDDGTWTRHEANGNISIEHSHGGR